MDDRYLKADIVVEDSRGFRYTVQIEHTPQHGFSTAYYHGRIIAQCSYGRMLQPQSDDDREWEQWEESFQEWAGAAISDLTGFCKEHFDRQ